MKMLSDKAIDILIYYAGIPDVLNSFPVEIIKSGSGIPDKDDFEAALQELIDGGFVEESEINNNESKQEYAATQLGAKFVANLAQERHTEIIARRNISDILTKSDSVVGTGILGDPVFGSSGASMTGASMTGPSMGPSLPQRTLQTIADTLGEKRYANVSDYPELFAELSEKIEKLSTALDQALEENPTNNWLNGEELARLKAELRATSAQLSEGRVRKGQLKDGLSPALTGALVIVAAYPGMRQLIEDLLTVTMALIGKL